MYTRRQIIQLLSALGMSLKLPAVLAQTPQSSLLTKTIYSSGESLPAIGMGTWITFDHNPKHVDVNHYIKILNTFFTMGGKLIDSSPMYGYAQQLLGAVLPQVDQANNLFSATKVWIPGKQAGIEQMDQSINLWQQQHMDLMQVHNLLDWPTHLATLNQWKAEGKIKYTGITTSHGRRHGELIRLLQQHPVDFVQFTYNMEDREAEQRLLPLAMDQGVAVIINRPFQTGGLFARVRNQPLPAWAAELGCQTWAQFFLKFVVSHPAITCAIPATSQVTHMQENMAALTGVVPDSQLRKDMLDYYQSIT